MLQADSEKLRQAWVQAVQASIASAYRESPDSCYSEVCCFSPSMCIYLCTPQTAPVGYFMLVQLVCACVYVQCLRLHVYMHADLCLRGTSLCQPF